MLQIYAIFSKCPFHSIMNILGHICFLVILFYWGPVDFCPCLYYSLYWGFFTAFLITFSLFMAMVWPSTTFHILLDFSPPVTFLTPWQVFHIIPEGFSSEINQSADPPWPYYEIWPLLPQ